MYIILKLRRTLSKIILKYLKPGREGQLIRSSYYNYKSLPLNGLEKTTTKRQRISSHEH